MRPLLTTLATISLLIGMGLGLLWAQSFSRPGVSSISLPPSVRLVFIATDMQLQWQHDPSFDLTQHMPPHAYTNFFVGSYASAWLDPAYAATLHDPVGTRATLLFTLPAASYLIHTAKHPARKGGHKRALSRRSFSLHFTRRAFSSDVVDHA